MACFELSCCASKRKSLHIAIAVMISTNGANNLCFSRKCEGAEAVAFKCISASSQLI